MPLRKREKMPRSGFVDCWTRLSILPARLWSDLAGKMATAVNGVFREELRDAVLRSKVLVVGAGGIGCEILKNLVMSGFADIEIVSIHNSMIFNVRM